MKRCTWCGEEGGKFCEDASRKDGLALQCSICSSIRHKRYHARNVGKIKEAARLDAMLEARKDSTLYHNEEATPDENYVPKRTQVGGKPKVFKYKFRVK